MRHDDETAQQEREVGISILTAALYESKIKDSEIVRLLQKYYGLREDEAQEQIRIYYRSWHCRYAQARERSLEAVSKGATKEN